MPKIIVLASGTRGDVQPAVALSSYLNMHGYDVTICGGLNIKDLADAYDCRFIPIGEDNEAFVARAPDPTRQPLKATKALTDYVLKEMAIQFDQFPEKAGESDLILGATFGFAASSIAEALNKPFGYMAYCPQVLESSQHPALFVKNHRHSPLLNRISWYCFKTLVNVSYRSCINANRNKLGLKPIRDCWEHILGHKILLLCDREYTAVPSDLRQTCYHIGYLPMHKHEDLDADLLRFIAAGSKPVYVGFGSMTAHEPAKTTQIVTEAAKIAGQRIVLSSGWAKLGSEVETNPDCYVLGKCDHALLFPKMAAIIHHGGSGTTATAARAGVPQIIIPHMTDQYYFAEQIPQFGIAPQSIWRKHLTARRLANAINAAISDAGMQQRCRSLAEKLARHDSYALAEKYIREEFLK